MENQETQTRKMNEAQIAKIKVQLERISSAFRSIKKSGISQEILVAFIKDRSGMGKQDILKVLNCQQEFYAKLSKLIEE